jgi:hypothetical protein
MKPEYKAEYQKLGLPISIRFIGGKEPHVFSISDDKYIAPLGAVPQRLQDHIEKSANNYHALKSAVEELREALDYALSHEPCDETDSVMEKALKQTEGLV